ncbi:gtp-binding protein [Stylonychia lemnae]|uniref:Gtp-binding protein n=1 Tax=Stylonychia lemnae TaxID=5949 RepID=A0A077ZVK5_STYLE|nr:gtp-binding protein [Stylonychia lemnae]|eukprot:CDW73656.1 gtp-binding protein [Stylonychia lemnae]
MIEPKKLLEVQLDLEHKKPQIQIYDENLDNVLNDNKQAFVIGILGRQQIGKSTFLRSCFDVKFKSSSAESQGKQTTVGQDIAVRKADQYDLVLIDAEGFGSSESKEKYKNQIFWTSDQKKKRKIARNLSKFSLALQSVFLLDICDILFVVNEYNHDWEDFEEFIDNYQKFNNQEISLPQIIYLIKGADTKNKQQLAVTNLQQAFANENTEGNDPQNFDNKNNNRITDIKYHFLPSYSGDDSVYKQKNDLILSFIEDTIKNQ